MKTKLSILLIFLSLSAFGQKIEWKPILIKSTCFFVAGTFEGVRDEIDFHYSEFQHTFPNANPQFCNPDLSHLNKWKNHDPLQGEAFWQSSRLFVGTTDLYHNMNLNRNIFLVVGAAIPINGKKKWYVYCIEAATYWAAFNTGKTVVFELIK